MPVMAKAVIAVTSQSLGCTRALSIRGLRVGVAVGGTAKDLRGRADLGFGRLQDGGPGRPGPRRERLAQVPVAGILGRDGQALPFGERARERAVPGGQVFDPLARFRGRLPDGEGELVALVLGGGLGFGRAQRRVVLAGWRRRSSASAVVAR
jgi:hypothetical protein